MNNYDPLGMFGSKNKKPKTIFDNSYSMSSKKEKERDSRRSFGKDQRAQILYQQNNKCAICKHSLDPRDIEYDHEKAWADGGRTITENGRAVCGSCHNKISHSQRLKKTDKKRVSKKTDAFPNLLGKPPKFF